RAPRRPDPFQACRRKVRGRVVLPCQYAVCVLIPLRTLRFLRAGGSGKNDHAKAGTPHESVPHTSWALPRLPEAPRLPPNPRVLDASPPFPYCPGRAGEDLRRESASRTDLWSVGTDQGSALRVVFAGFSRQRVKTCRGASGSCAGWSSASSADSPAPSGSTSA